MKTPQDPRHQRRIQIMQKLFAWEFQPDKNPQSTEVLEIIDNLKTIDQEIEKAAPAWPIDKINKTDLAILRLATFELIILKSIPFRVVVDEAVELSKRFGTESSPSFINGALGNLISAHRLDK